MAQEINVRVKYVGKKPFAVDNVAGSGKTWAGPGDVQVVTEEQGKKLGAFPDQWTVIGASRAKAEDDTAAIAALKELGADPATPTPSADVAGALASIKAAAAAKAASKANKKTDAVKKAAASDPLPPADNFKD